MKKTQIVSTVDFYNSIADAYDTFLDNDNDRNIRRGVAEYFIKNIKPGRVLDFGSGTGLDLPWLTASGNKVVVYEPSEGMRMRAQKLAEKLNNPDIEFLQEPVLIPGAYDLSLPSLKVDSVLANFGVVNYVDDLPQLFSMFASLLPDDGNVVINLLYPSQWRLFSRHFRGTLKALLSGNVIKTGSSYNGSVHQTNLYRLNHITSASANYFDIKNKFVLNKNSDFLLLHLIKR